MSPGVKQATVRTRRAYDRFCPLSQALDQVGDRWTLHILMALIGGPKRYTDLKKILAGAGTNILSDRLRELVTNRLVMRAAGETPGSETTYRLTERGWQLAPVIGGLARWGLELMTWTAPGSDEKNEEAFDRTWTDELDMPASETYQWIIEGVEFQIAVDGNELIQTRGRAARPTVTMRSTNGALGDIVTGQRSVAESVAAKQIQLKGSKAAVERMFRAVGFPLARLK